MIWTIELDPTVYLTAQRVTRLSDGATAIHSFRLLHRRPLGVNLGWTAKEIEEIANHDPGQLVAKHLELPQGGNRVLSYLEVVCEDETAPEVLRQVLTHFVPAPHSAREEAIVCCSNLGPFVALLFVNLVGLPGNEADEFDALRCAIWRVLPEGGPGPF